MGLTADEIKIVRSTVPVLQAHGTQITTTFYNNLLHDAPSLWDIFSVTNQKNGAQPRALAGSLLAYAANIDDLGVLAPAVERICQKHVSLYIQPAQYDVVGKYLLAAMGEVLGDALTPDVLAAWAAAYTQLANVLIGKEAQLYSEFDGWTDWRKFKIAKKVKEADNITSFYLEPEDGKPLPKFKPGQYVSVQLAVPSFGYLQSRQYSLSDEPRSDYYRISVKREAGVAPEGGEVVNEAGLVSNILHDKTEIGDLIGVSHPAGEFFLDPTEADQSPVVLISAGVGITPMVSILNTLVHHKSTRKISWIHTARSSALHAFRHHVHQISKSHANIHSVVFKSNVVDGDVNGEDYHFDVRMDLKKVHPATDLFLDDKSTTYYVCGPGVFMSEVAASLEGMGVSPDKIKMEVFGTGDLK
ncbi:flavohemoglobin [Phlyctema vagabunda]|uniref:nitric oxide dioxygenase n=1 Tax=Phlyctema vagabunda TaxID=108571 RepID=A0ABR4PD81_9HELO